MSSYDYTTAVPDKMNKDLEMLEDKTGLKKHLIVKRGIVSEINRLKRELNHESDRP